MGFNLVCVILLTIHCTTIITNVIFIINITFVIIIGRSILIFSIISLLFFYYYAMRFP